MSTSDHPEGRNYVIGSVAISPKYHADPDPSLITCDNRISYIDSIRIVYDKYRVYTLHYTRFHNIKRFIIKRHADDSCSIINHFPST